MPFDNDKWQSVPRNGDVGGAYLNIAITITPIIEALEKIEASTGVDLSAERRRLRELNDNSFKRFIELTGWEES